MQSRRIDDALRRSARGDEEAFENLYREMRGGVYSFVYTYFNNPHDAEDVMQTVFLKVKLNLDKYRHGSNGVAWILEIAKNTSLTELARRKRFTELSDYETSASVDYNLDEGSPVTEAMNRVLSSEEKRIITLHVIWGYKFREIASALDMPTGTVTSKYKRAVDKLKTELKEDASR